jgi:hypothetical protein
MVLVRIVFQAKLGHAGQVAAGMREGMEKMRGMSAMQPKHVRILTDLSGQFDTVVQEMEFDSLDQFMKNQEAMFADPRWRDIFSSSVDHLLGGSKEYYTVEYEE